MAITSQNPFKTLPHETRARRRSFFNNSCKSLYSLPRFSSSFASQFKDGKRWSNGRLEYVRRRKSSSCCSVDRAIRIGGRFSEGGGLSVWDEKPYLLLPGGERAYLDEQDVVAFLDPPKELIPLDPASYNAAAYVWKKIGDIPEERRHRLLYLLKPRLVSRLWEIAGTRYDDSKLAKQSASSLLSDGDNVVQLEFWNCRTSGVAWINFFKKAIFCGSDGRTHGRLIIGGSLLGGIANSFSPLYFTVSKCKEILSTEQPCDLTYEFGDGLLDLNDYPPGFPRPVKHPWPFDDDIVMYVRHVGPGVLVVQAWREGKALEQLPKKFCGHRGHFSPHLPSVCLTLLWNFGRKLYAKRASVFV